MWSGVGRSPRKCPQAGGHPTHSGLTQSPAHHLSSLCLLLAPIAPGVGWGLSLEPLGAPPKPYRGAVLLWPWWSGDCSPSFSKTICSTSGACAGPPQAPSSSPCPQFKPLSPPELPTQSSLTTCQGDTIRAHTPQLGSLVKPLFCSTPHTSPVHILQSHWPRCFWSPLNSILPLSPGCDLCLTCFFLCLLPVI